jgi:type IV pilus assembly protein PilE
MRSSLASKVYVARNSLQSRLQGMRGMTLIELMTVVVILAILTTIAVGSYRRYLMRTNRTEATAALLRVQVAQEKHYLQNNTYTANMALLGVPVETPNGQYQLAIGPPANGDLATGFIATATAIGGQVSDSACRGITIDDRGRRGASPGTADLCWR